MGIANHTARPCNDAGAEQIESGRVEEVDVALLVIARGEAEARQRLPDLMVRNRRLDLDGFGALHGLGDLAARCRSPLHDLVLLDTFA